MLSLLLAAALQMASPEAKALLDAIERSIASAKSAIAASPPPKDDAERIVRLGKIDEAPRRIITTYDFALIPLVEREAATKAAGALIDAQDAANLQALLALVPAEGWFAKSRYGEEAASAAFHIVQHSNAPNWRRFLPTLEAMAKKGEADGADVAAMYDRLAIDEGRLQRYGTHFRCDFGKWRSWPMEDPAGVEARRRAVGIEISLPELREIMAKGPVCPQTQSPAPPGMVFD